MFVLWQEANAWGCLELTSLICVSLSGSHFVVLAHFVSCFFNFGCFMYEYVLDTTLTAHPGLEEI